MEKNAGRSGKDVPVCLITGARKANVDPMCVHICQVWSTAISVNTLLISKRIPDQSDKYGITILIVTDGYVLIEYIFSRIRVLLLCITTQIDYVGLN